MYKAMTIHLGIGGAKTTDVYRYLSDCIAMGDYYSGKSVPGVWSGSMLSHLSIVPGEISGSMMGAFSNLLTGMHPSNGQLLKTKKAMSRGVAGYDFTVSPHKSISVMSFFDERVIQAHKNANFIAMQALEKFASRRMRTGHVSNRIELPNRYTGNLAACSFVHDSSRANDPLLHTHNFIFNITMDTDGKFYSLDQKMMRKAIKYASNIYTSEVTRNLRELGYEMADVKNEKGRIVTSKIAAVSEDICDALSSRHMDIQRKVAAKEKEENRKLTDKEISNIVLTSRARKKALSTNDKIKTIQQRIGKKSYAFLEDLAAKSISKEASLGKGEEIEKAMEMAVEHVFERKSVASVKEILEDVLTQNFGRFDFSYLEHFVQSKALSTFGMLEIDPDINKPMEEQFVTTVPSLQREKFAIDFVDAGIDKTKALAPEFEAFVGAKILDYEEQKEVVEGVLHSKDVVTSIHGIAGTGKTTALKELVKGLQSNNHQKIVMLAPTNSAVKELREQGFMQASTLSRFIHQAKDIDLGGSVFILDEAGLVSSSDGTELFRFAQDNGARVILVGDSRQHSAVEAGDFMRNLEKYSKLNQFHLRKINRQKDPEYKQAVKAMSKGKTVEGLIMLDEKGWIVERKEYIAAAANEYDYDGSCLAVAPTNKEVDLLNEYIREKLIEEGKLGKEARYTIFRKYDISNSHKVTGKNYSIGDAIRVTHSFDNLPRGGVYQVKEIKGNKLTLETGQSFDVARASESIEVGKLQTINIGVGERLIATANDRAHGIVNGERFQVLGREEEQLIVLDQFNQQKLLKPHWLDLNYSYATTSHKSQGQTVDKVIIAGAMMGQEYAYVSASRGKHECKIFTPDKNKMIDHIIKGGRPLAMDLIHEYDQHDKEFIKYLDKAEGAQYLANILEAARQEMVFEQQRQFEIWQEHCQEVEKSLSFEFEAVNYEKQIRALVDREQELQEQIEARHERVRQLEKEISELKAIKINKLLSPSKAKRHEKEIAAKNKAFEEAMEIAQKTDLKGLIMEVRRERVKLTMKFKEQKMEKTKKGFEKVIEKDLGFEMEF